jgi:UDP-N-acetylglucosamine 2-epimerase (non-hydrolysing)
MSPQPHRRPIAIVLGTRPEIIKLARITELLGDEAHVVHTGQHYDPALSANFFSEFSMRQPDTHIGVGGQTRGAQIGNGTAALDDLFSTLRPAAVVVQGDTNAVAAGALAANAREIPLVHVEAGLRSFDRRMPEEHNRVIADHLSDLCLAATDLNVANLSSEGIGGSRVVLSGNPIVEAVERLMPSSGDQAKLLASFDVEEDGFVLATFHRPENVDDVETLSTVLDALAGIGHPVLLPLHPRTQQRIAEFGLDQRAASLRIVDPIGYRDFLGLGTNARLLVSDSGGVQEEVSVYKKPAVVVRRSTERQEVEGTFVTRLEPKSDLGSALVSAWDSAIDKAHALASIPSPYGDATSPAKAVAAIRDLVERSS